jgi:hypothetical protein
MACIHNLTIIECHVRFLIPHAVVLLSLAQLQTKLPSLLSHELLVILNDALNQLLRPLEELHPYLHDSLKL